MRRREALGIAAPERQHTRGQRGHDRSGCRVFGLGRKDERQRLEEPPGRGQRAAGVNEVGKEKAHGEIRLRISRRPGEWRASGNGAGVLLSPRIGGDLDLEP